ncbi:MAG: hypothetical protein WBD27_18275 [Pyrinomonadaceae bacterium]
MRMSMIALFAAMVLSVSTFGQKIEGVWSLTEITTTGAGGSTKQMSQPSMYLFTKKHYSIIYVSSDAPRSATADSSKMTAEELRNVFVDSFIANAGTYELKAGKLTVRPMVAKSPGYMQPGVFTTQSVKIDGNMMTLVSDSSNTGPSTNPTTYKLKRVE